MVASLQKSTHQSTVVGKQSGKYGHVVVSLQGEAGVEQASSSTQIGV